MTRPRSDDYNYDWLTDEEYEALDWDASLTLICRSEDSCWAELVSIFLYDRGLVSAEDGFSVLPVDADLAFQIRAVSVKEFNERDQMDLSDFVRGLPWEYSGAVYLQAYRNDNIIWTTTV